MRTPGTVRFFHLAGHSARGNAGFTRTTDYRCFITRLRTGLSASPQRLISFVVLPGQWHLVVGPTDARTSLALLGRVAETHPLDRTRPGNKRRVSHDASFVDFEPLTSPGHLIRRCRDVERAPCGLGLVARAQDWPWGSAAERFLMLNRLPLAATGFLTSRLWLDALNAPGHVHWIGDRTALRDLSQVPGRLTGVVQGRHQQLRLAGISHEDHSYPHVEGAEHLVI